MNPVQSTAVSIKDLIVIIVCFLERSAKRPEGIAVDLASGTNNLPGNSTHGFGPQWGNLYFEESGRAHHQ